MKKYLKKADNISFDFISDNCPIGLKSGTIYTDIETNDIFLSLSLRNLSKKEISKLSLNLYLFDNEYANLPYKKINTYYDLNQPTDDIYIASLNLKQKPGFAKQGELFGELNLIPIPESYFKKIKPEIVSIEYSDGSIVSIGSTNQVSIETFESLQPIQKIVYEKINIYKKTEESYPARHIPTQNNSSWVCCCGEKNPADADTCLICRRTKKWQFENISQETLNRKAKDMDDMKKPENIYFAKEKRYKKPSSTIQEKAELEKLREIERTKKRVEKQLLLAERRKKRAMNLLLIWLVIIAVAIVFSIMK